MPLFCFLAKLLELFIQSVFPFSPEGSYTDDTSQEHHTPRHRPAQPTQPIHDPHEFDDEFDDDDPLPVIGHCKALYSFDGRNKQNGGIEGAGPVKKNV